VLKSAVVVWTLLMIVAGAVWLVLPNRDAESTVGFLMAAVCMVVVGGILTLRHPSNSVGPLALVAGSSLVIYLFGNGYAIASLRSTGVEYPGAYFFGWLGGWVGALFPICLAVLILVFPSGRPIGWWRVGLIAPVVGAVSAVVGAGIIWGLPLATLVSVDRLDVARGYAFVDAGFILGYLSAVVSSISVVARYRAAGFVERQQIKWLLAATGFFALAYMAGAVTEDNEALWWVVAVAVTTIPLAILFAVLRYRLYEIDRILSRTVAYGLVIGLLAAVFFGVVTAASSLLPTESDLAIAASTLAVAGLFNPVRKRVQKWVDRRFNRSRYDAQRVIDRFAGSLRNQVDPDYVIEGWMGVVSETMQPISAGIWVRNDFGTMAG
jgi:hypothetical protein